VYASSKLVFHVAPCSTGQAHNKQFWHCSVAALCWVNAVLQVRLVWQGRVCIGVLGPAGLGIWIRLAWFLSTGSFWGCAHASARMILGTVTLISWPNSPRSCLLEVLRSAPRAVASYDLQFWGSSCLFVSQQLCDCALLCLRHCMTAGWCCVALETDAVPVRRQVKYAPGFQTHQVCQWYPLSLRTASLGQVVASSTIHCMLSCTERVRRSLICIEALCCGVYWYDCIHA
jgi:hypothetical protein